MAAYRQAVTDLSGSLAGVPGYEHRDWPCIAGRIGALGAGFDQPVSVLTLQMTALANLLDAAAPAPGGPTPARAGSVEDWLLLSRTPLLARRAAGRPSVHLAKRTAG
jgi:hypothetical protein